MSSHAYMLSKNWRIRSKLNQYLPLGELFKPRRSQNTPQRCHCSKNLCALSFILQYLMDGKTIHLHSGALTFFCLLAHCAISWLCIQENLCYFRIHTRFAKHLYNLSHIVRTIKKVKLPLNSYPCKRLDKKVETHQYN